MEICLCIRGLWFRGTWIFRDFFEVLGMYVVSFRRFLSEVDGTLQLWHIYTDFFEW